MTRTTDKINPLRLGRKARPTMKHRPAIWECMLGTVYAMNAEGVIRYFDYHWDEALDFAGVDTSDDLRTHKPVRRCRWGNGADTTMEPRFTQQVLWVTK